MLDAELYGAMPGTVEYDRSTILIALQDLVMRMAKTVAVSGWKNDVTWRDLVNKVGMRRGLAAMMRGNQDIGRQ